jgi:signal transduction histidine kinase
MLKNMKVGTKLIAVLVAPVLVLLILGYVGVSQRLSTSQSTQRTEQLAQMAAVNSTLANQLQHEMVYSAAYMASVGTQWRPQLDTQRKKTDVAIASYKTTLAKVNPGKDSLDLRTQVSAVNDAITNLSVQRGSVDGLETPAPTAISQYDTASQALAQFDTAIAHATTDPTLSRDLTTFSNSNSYKESTADESALSVALATIQQFPKTWPAAGQTPVPCDVVNSDSNCQVFLQLNTAKTTADNELGVFTDSATADQKGFQRTAAGRPSSTNMGAFEAQIFDTVSNAYPSETGTSGTATGPVLNATNSVPTSPAPGTPNLSPYSPKIALDANHTFHPIDSAAIVTAANGQLDDLKTTENLIIGQVASQAQSLRSQAQREATLFVIGAFGAIAIALLIAFYVARAVTVPLKKLTSAAYTLSTDKLPGLVERLRNPDESMGSLSEALQPIDIHSKDEIGQLADAFNSIQHVTVEVAEEQGALLRKGIGDIFINLARRNQTLLDRQIEFIDQLEANEEDPDQLDNLFKLDHLATRMRRNAESLLVLAGAEPPRRRGRPVALADVVRVAIGEVEDFARISLLALDEVTVGGNVAVDLAHLLSELMENATHFSPPDTTVEIVGHQSNEGYTLSVSDQGIGMSADQLAEANQQLARPPLVGLALSRSLGFIVIGRLASRFGVVVKLTSSPSGGVTALVQLPGDLVSVDGQPLAPAPSADLPAPPTAEAPAPPVDELVPYQPLSYAEPDPDADVIVIDEATDAEIVADGQAGRELELDDFEAEVLDLHPEAEAPAEVAEADADADADLLDELVEEPNSYLDAVPEGDEFERGLQSLVSDELAPGPVEGAPGQLPTEPATDGLSDTDSVPGAFGTPTILDEPPAPAASPEVQAPEAAPDEAPLVSASTTTVDAKPGETPLTAAGLVKRTPKKRDEDATGGGMPIMASRGTGASQRSPEEVRKMLSRYRSGLNKGRGGADGSTTDTTDS